MQDKLWSVLQHSCVQSVRPFAARLPTSAIVMIKVSKWTLPIAVDYNQILWGSSRDLLRNEMGSVHAFHLTKYITAARWVCDAASKWRLPDKSYQRKKIMINIFFSKSSNIFFFFPSSVWFRDFHSLCRMWETLVKCEDMRCKADLRSKYREFFFNTHNGHFLLQVVHVLSSRSPPLLLLGGSVIFVLCGGNAVTVWPAILQTYT